MQNDVLHISSSFFCFLLFFVYVCTDAAPNPAGPGEEGGALTFRKDVYLTFLSLTLQNFATSQLSQNKSNGRCLRGMLYTIVHFFTNKRCALLLYISAWAISALLVQTTMGNARASKSETGNKYRFPRFFFLYGLVIIYFEPSGSGSLLEKR